MLEEFTVGIGLGNLFSNPEFFSMAHDYGRMRKSGEFGTRECGRGYSWSLRQTKICKGKFNYSTSGLKRSSRDTNNQTTYSITDPAFRKYKTLAISDPNGLKNHTLWRGTHVYSLHKGVATGIIIRLGELLTSYWAICSCWNTSTLLWETNKWHFLVQSCWTIQLQKSFRKEQR